MYSQDLLAKETRGVNESFRKLALFQNKGKNLLNCTDSFCDDIKNVF